VNDFAKLPPKGAPYSRVMRESLKEARKLKHRLDHVGPHGTAADKRYGKTWRLGR